MNKQRTIARAGFTAIEILIVVAIIALLMSITAGALIRVKAASERTATETTLTKLASMLDRHWKAVIDLAKKEYDGLPTNIKQNLIALADNTSPPSDPRRDDRARLLYVKLRLKQEFPTSFFTALFPGTIGRTTTTYYLPPSPVPPFTRPNNLPFTGKPAYVKACYDPATDKPKIDLAIEKQSSALLVMALEQGRSGVAPETLDQSVGSTFIKQENGYRYLVDTWGNPLRLFIFPTNDSQMLSDLVRNPAIAGDKDPQDPEDLLIVASTPPIWTNPSFPALLHPQIPFQKLLKLVPIIVSAGPDGQLGLFEAPESALTGPYMTPVPANTAPLPLSTNKRNPEDRFDNLYSFRLRQTGARGD
jgi:prepilin-type N-terminal cleavage/methylation domain-containing protein